MILMIMMVWGSGLTVICSSYFKKSRSEFTGVTYVHSDAFLLDSGIKCLSENLGLVEAERFISLLIKEPFDYTKWRRDNLCVNMSVKDISNAAAEHWNEQHSK